MGVVTNRKLDVLMQNYISSTGHNDTGRLAKSISFKSTLINGKFDMGLKANSYILFLDNGNFIQNFMKLPAVKKTIAEFITVSLLED